MSIESGRIKTEKIVDTLLLTGNFLGHPSDETWEMLEKHRGKGPPEAYLKTLIHQCIERKVPKIFDFLEFSAQVFLERRHIDGLVVGIQYCVSESVKTAQEVDLEGKEQEEVRVGRDLIDSLELLCKQDPAPVGVDAGRQCLYGVAANQHLASTPYALRHRAIEVLGRMHSAETQQLLCSLMSSAVTSIKESGDQTPTNPGSAVAKYELVISLSKALKEQVGAGKIDAPVFENLKAVYEDIGTFNHRIISAPQYCIRLLDDWMQIQQRYGVRVQSRGLKASSGAVFEDTDIRDAIDNLPAEPDKNRQIEMLRAIVSAEEGSRLLTSAVKKDPDLASVVAGCLYKAFCKDSTLQRQLSALLPFVLRALPDHAKAMYFVGYALADKRQLAVRGQKELIRFLRRPAKSEDEIDAKETIVDMLFGLPNSDHLDTSHEKMFKTQRALFRQRTRYSFHFLKDLSSTLEALKVELPVAEYLPRIIRQLGFAHTTESLYGAHPSVLLAMQTPEAYKELLLALKKHRPDLELFVEYDNLMPRLIAALRNPPEGVPLDIAKEGIAYGEALQRAQELGIKTPFRFPSQTLIWLVAERENPHKYKQDGKPVAIVYAAHRHADHNGAMYSLDILVEDLKAHNFHVLYLEPVDSNPLFELGRYKHHYQLPVHFLALCGHGSAHPQASMLIHDPRRRHARINQRELYLSGLKGYVEPSGAVLLGACEAGWGGDNSLLNACEDTLASQGVVIANKRSGPGFRRLRYDENGMVSGARVTNKNQEVYITDRSQIKERTGDGLAGKLMRALFG